MRLSSSNNEPDEAGSDGPHEGVVQPLVLGMNRDRRAIAAPVIQIDRLLADFAGGRWVFANFSGSLDVVALVALAQTADHKARAVLKLRAILHVTGRVKPHRYQFA